MKEEKTKSLSSGLKLAVFRTVANFESHLAAALNLPLVF
jgi:hypothetical protein